MFLGIVILPLTAFIMIFISFKLHEDNAPLRLIFFFMGLLLTLASISMTKNVVNAYSDFNSYGFLSYMNIMLIFTIGFTFFYYMLEYFKTTFGILIDFSKFKRKHREDF